MAEASNCRTVQGFRVLRFRVFGVCRALSFGVA